jgi:hypothetical protein
MAQYTVSRLCTKSPVSKLTLQINEDFLISFWRFFETIEAHVDHKKPSRNDF